MIIHVTKENFEEEVLKVVKRITFIKEPSIVIIFSTIWRIIWYTIRYFQ